MRAFVCLVVFLPRLEDSYVVVVVVVVVSCLHGADVLQGFHSIISHSKLKDSLSPTLKFAALTAALVHDIGHPGRNNKFLIDSKKTRTDIVVVVAISEVSVFLNVVVLLILIVLLLLLLLQLFNTLASHDIAIRYNDRSVLENFHIASALDISKRNECNIFANMKDKDAAYKEIRLTWIDLILDTDMARHFSVVKELDAKLKKAADNGTVYCCSDQSHQTFTLSVLLHCCDLGNPTKSWDTYQTWTSRVMEEFHSQAEVEVEAGRPPSMPRNDANFNLGKFQQGFLRFIRPFFVSVTIIDGVNLTELISNLDKNLVTWKEKEAKEAEAEAGKEVGTK